MAFREAAALAEVERLMARIPGVVPVRIVAGRRRFAMARSARLVERGRREDFRISDSRLDPLQPDMRNSRPVASLTLDSALERHNARSIRQLQRTRRMTLKATQDRRTGIECSISFARWCPVARRERHSFRFLEVRKSVLEVVFFIQTADKGNRLFARPEGPIARGLGKGRSQRMFRRLRQCSSMACLSMSGELRRMTVLALFTPCILALCDAGQKQ